MLLLSGCAVLRDEPPERTVRVRVLADSKLRAIDPRWRETAGGLLRVASDFYEREFGIKLAATEVASWEYDEETPLVTTLLKTLMKEYPVRGDNDVTVGLTGERLGIIAGGRGLARLGNCDEGLGRYLVSSVTEPYHYSGRTTELTLDAVALIHEFGHIFGAVHSEDRNSIMHIPFDYRSDFDPESRAIVQKNKLCRFAK